PLRGGAVRPRPLARPRADRGVSRPADGRTTARGLPPPGPPSRRGRRQRPPDQGRGPVPRQPAHLQPALLDDPELVPEQRPSLTPASPRDTPGAGANAGAVGKRRRRG